ncbi:sodium/proline symporter PutP [Propioniciclava soli]|uniref:sodium/proline symporter PutP n=1 Tax=Propioniciclava soli TaxID=2775081 RepID=UPI001E5AA81C|nr:sodium/proline symporter PutP [Propioniciclava soli]
MGTDLIWQVVSMLIYLIAMVTIGFVAQARTKDLGDFMLGGRGLGPFVAALSAGASDMSGWLLMGLPGALYLSGLVELWIAVGLTVGAWLNWKFVAPRLRAYTQLAADSITLPSYLGARLRDPYAIRLVAGAIILVFFTLYVSSGMVAGGTFFESSFGLPYLAGMLLVAGVTVLYTLVGGFLAVSWTDVVQGCMMVTALVLLPIVGVIHVGGPGAMLDAINAVDPSLLSFTSGATVVGVVSSLSWGLGYFGQPHILVRFMALTDAAEATAGRRIGITWMVLSCLGAAATALVGIAVYTHDTGQLANPEAVFITLGQLLFHPLLAGFLLAAILAAIMSTISSQLLVTSSALVEDIFRAFAGREISARGGLWLGRAGVLLVSVVAALLALNPSGTILDLVAFAWAGFGAGFGPTILLSLFWRRLTSVGALAGMIVGALVVFWWGSVDGGLFDLYEILPGFLANLLVAVGVSRLTGAPSGVDAEFEEVAALARH